MKTKIFIKFYILLKLLAEITLVVSYTVVLKPVKPVLPSVKVYRYGLRQPKIITDNQYLYHIPVSSQRLYPVIVKQQRDSHIRTRIPLKKEKKKFLPKPFTTEKPTLKDQRLYEIPQQLMPPISNQIEEYSDSKEEEPRKKEQESDNGHSLLPFQNEKSFSSFGQEKGRIYNKPGDWATPVPSLETENATKPLFTPSQLYLQIRHKNTVIHVPQSEALKDAETLEELINAPRLKELARTTHVQEVYSEEGYEDAGYDHAGHIRHAQHGEVYNAKDEGKFRIKQPPIILDYDSDLEETKRTPLKNISSSENNFADEKTNDKLEPRITFSKTETTKKSVDYAKIPSGYKGEHKYSSRVKAPLKFVDGKTSNFNAFNQENSGFKPIFPSYFGEMPPAPDSILGNDSFVLVKPADIKPIEHQLKINNSTKIYPIDDTPAMVSVPTKDLSNFKPFLSVSDSQASPSSKSLKYSRIYSKKTKQLRLEPYQTGNVYKPHSPKNLQPPPETAVEEESINQRIVLPTIGYINSLTTAHFGKGNVLSSKEEPKSQLTSTLNLTEALNYLRSNKNQKFQESTKGPTESDVRSFEPMKLKKSRTRPFKKTKRDVYSKKEGDRKPETYQEDYEGNDENDQPHVEKSKEIMEDEKRRIEEENIEKEKYEKALKDEISQKETEIIKETFKNIGVSEDVSEVFPELPFSNFKPDPHPSFHETTESPVDLIKYPFYLSKKLPENSPLRYATDPKKFPRKSGFKMEFYESRDDYIQCPDFHPNLDDLPNSNSTEYSDEQAGENQRLAGVGDKIMCLRMKYFDIEPFDNPIFKEKEIDYVGKHRRRYKVLKAKKEPKQKNSKNTTLQGTKTLLSLPKEKEAKGSFTTLSRQLIKNLEPSNKTIQKAQSVRNPVRNSTQHFSHQLLMPEVNPKRLIPVTEKIGESLIHDYLTKHHLIQTAPQTFNKMVSLKPNYGELKQIANANRITVPYNCIPIIGEMSVIDGTKNLIVECKDAVLIQSLINNLAYLRVIPKELPKLENSSAKTAKVASDEKHFNETDWIPILESSYRNNPRAIVASRKTDEIPFAKNQTSSNTNSDHYLIDELKEDENVRKGEVVEDMNHYLELIKNVTKTNVLEATTLMNDLLQVKNETRKKREAFNESSKFKAQEISSKRPTLIEKKEFDLIEKATEKKDGLGTQYLEASNNGTTVLRPFEQKRTLTRLSGKDFLTRYHKNKAKPITQDKTADFWKVPTSSSNAYKKIQTTISPSTLFSSPRTPKPANGTTPSTAETLKISPKNNTIVKTSNTTNARQINTIQSTSNLKIVSEKVTKKPETRQTSEFRTIKSEKLKSRDQNYTKIITTVSKVISESIEKAQNTRKIQINVDKQVNTPEITNKSHKQEFPKYKTINRSSQNLKKNITEDMNGYIEPTDGPILYYIVDSRTGRGKWITNYEEQKKSPGKFRKLQKLGPKVKAEKRRKKQKN